MDREVVTHPFGPSSTKMPWFGISTLKSEIAVTIVFLPVNERVVNSLPRLRIEIAMLGGGGVTSTLFFFRRPHHLVLALCVSYKLRSQSAPMYGQIRTATCTNRSP